MKKARRMTMTSIRLWSFCPQTALQATLIPKYMHKTTIFREPGRVQGRLPMTGHGDTCPPDRVPCLEGRQSPFGVKVTIFERDCNEQPPFAGVWGVPLWRQFSEIRAGFQG